MIRNRALSFALFALLVTSALHAQPAPPAPTGPPAPQDRHISRNVDIKVKRDGSDHAGMGIVPPGTWWKNPATVTALTLTADQQKKLDDIFLQSRIGLIHLHASLEEEQLKLEPLLNANPPDQAKSMAQISKIADLRADLEKSNAKMLLSLRGVLTADQWTKLQADQRSRREDIGEGRGIGRGIGHDPQGPQPQRRGEPNGPGMPPPGAPPND